VWQNGNGRRFRRKKCLPPDADRNTVRPVAQKCLYGVLLITSSIVTERPTRGLQAFPHPKSG